MDVTETVLRPSAIPPTTNTLDSHQRTRLIRSARKLGSVLGSTPHLIEPETESFVVPVPMLPIGPSSSRSCTPKSFASRRHGSIFSSRPSTPSLYTSSTNSSMASLALPTPRASSDSLSERPQPVHVPATSKPRRSKELPHPLVLRLNAVPMAASDRRLAATLPPTPQTATTATTPITPTTPQPPNPSETRRKRMAKLKRTFGENIPFDLVFPTRAAKTPTQASFPTPSDAGLTPMPKSGRRRSASVDLSQTQLPPRRSSRVWVTGNDSWTGEWNRRDIREVQHQLRALKGR